MEVAIQQLGRWKVINRVRRPAGAEVVSCTRSGWMPPARASEERADPYNYQHIGCIRSSDQ